jgi:hypothetical protein
VRRKTALPEEAFRPNRTGPLRLDDATLLRLPLFGQLPSAGDPLPDFRNEGTKSVFKKIDLRLGRCAVAVEWQGLRGRVGG